MTHAPALRAPTLRGGLANTLILWPYYTELTLSYIEGIGLVRLVRQDSLAANNGEPICHYPRPVPLKHPQKKQAIQYLS